MTTKKKVSARKEKEEELREVLIKLFSCFEEDESQENMEAIKKATELYEEAGDDLYKSIVFLKILSLLEIPAMPILAKHPEVKGDDKFVLKSIYNGLFDHWIGRIIRCKEGWPFSGDKTLFIAQRLTRAILEQKNLPLHVNYSDMGEEKCREFDWDPDKKAYWSPDSFKDTNEAKEAFVEWWHVTEDEL